LQEDIQKYFLEITISSNRKELQAFFKEKRNILRTFQKINLCVGLLEEGNSKKCEV